MSEVPQCRPAHRAIRLFHDAPLGRQAVPGDSRSGPRARGVHLKSLMTRARFRENAGSTSFFGKLRACPSSSRVNQMSGRVRPGSEVLHVQPAVPATQVWVLRPAGSTRSPGSLAHWSKSRGVDLQSWAICAIVGRPAGSTCCPRRLALVSEGPRGRHEVFDDSGPVPSAGRDDQLFRAFRARVRGPAVFDQKYLVTRPISERPSGLPGLQGHSGPCPSTRGVDQLSRAIPSQLQGHAESTSSPGHSHLCASAHLVDQLPWVTGASVRRPSGLPS